MTVPANLGVATLAGIDGWLTAFMAELGIAGRIGPRHTVDNMTIQADQADIVFVVHLWHHFPVP